MLAQTLCVSLIVTFVSVFTGCASLRHILAFKQRKDPGSLCFSPLAPAGLAAGTPGSHPGSTHSVQDGSLLPARTLGAETRNPGVQGLH